ncbi:MAG TPA: hypothetical protein VJ044_09820, partial [Candidatus Hodarchaeales archaeon]|nr:hypothetical protein [Candidatus Hodarchaeales archaeon]
MNITCDDYEEKLLFRPKSDDLSMEKAGNDTSQPIGINIELLSGPESEAESPHVKTESGTKLGLSTRVRAQLEQKAYRIAGNHSAVQICSWTKKSIENSGDVHCYKQRFYGISCHKCAQITPVVAWCTERCTFCWRPMEFYKTVEISSEEVDPPRLIIERIIEERRKLLIGYKGNDSVSHEFILDALEPDHWAISLSGEPT